MEEKKRNVAQLQKQYSTRITLAKNGQEAYRAQDFKNAIKYYNLYLKLLADINDIPMENLSPQYFDKATRSSEIFLISQIYWDLAKLYDMSPSLKREMLHCLNKYVEFSLNFRFQVVNAESLRRYIRKGRCKNPESFQEAYKSIYITSKMCYIASFTFGSEHPHTETLRHLKLKMIKYRAGEFLVDQYYRYSPRLIYILERHPYLATIFQNTFSKPALSTLAKFLRSRIIRL